MPQDPSPSEPDLAMVAKLLGDRTRASFCIALMDARAWTAGELARHAGVAASTASEHLDALVAAGLLKEHRQGRHRYVSLRNSDVAETLERLASLAPPLVREPSTLTQSSRARALASARTCYDHLAGALAVQITDAMIAGGYLDAQHGLTLTNAGNQWFQHIGISWSPGRRPVTRECLDWTERRPHLAGAAAAALLRHAINHEWVRPRTECRALIVTATGRSALHAHLSFDVE